MRSALDKLISGAGFLMVAVLLVAGGLLTWAHVFIDNEVHDQLAQQNITMPAKADLETKAQHDALDQYAGQPLTTGPQAKAYADHYIAVHMDAASGGKTYSEISGQYVSMTDAQKATPAGPGASASSGRRSSWATPCAACCSTATPSPRSARSPSTRPSRASSAPVCCCCSRCWASGTHAGPRTSRSTPAVAVPA